MPLGTLVEGWLLDQNFMLPSDDHLDWSITANLLTMPLSFWHAAKSKLPSQALWFGFAAHWITDYPAFLMSRDERFKITRHTTPGS